mgnify:CR=1 FL=1
MAKVELRVLFKHTMLKVYFNLLKTYFVLPRYVKNSTLAKLIPLITFAAFLFAVKVVVVVI